MKAGTVGDKMCLALEVFAGSLRDVFWVLVEGGVERLPVMRADWLNWLSHRLAPFA